MVVVVRFSLLGQAMYEKSGAKAQPDDLVPGLGKGLVRWALWHTGQFVLGRGLAMHMRYHVSNIIM